MNDPHSPDFAMKAEGTVGAHTYCLQPNSKVKGTERGTNLFFSSWQFPVSIQVKRFHVQWPPRLFDAQNYCVCYEMTLL
jgi:hypothetical protein